MHPNRIASVLLITGLLTSLSQVSWGENLSITKVADGWHPWYELATDPEDSGTLLVCGSKWDSGQNTLSGFVYRSADGGKEWHEVLQDKHSPWVSEQSCAFGSHHRAYFFSEASAVYAGEPNHRLGTSRLFVSDNGGETWTQHLQMGWADWSTSAVSAADGELITFYQHSDVSAEGTSGSTIGALVFDPDGNQVRGPYLSEELRSKNYRGVYPFHAVSLNDGTVGALYYGRNGDPAGRSVDLGFAHLVGQPFRKLTVTQLAEFREKDGCSGGFGDIDLAYDRKSGTVAAVYLGAVKHDCGIVLATSTDGGSNWTTKLLAKRELFQERVVRPSIAFGRAGEIGLLWLTATGEWRFGTSKDARWNERPLTLWDAPSKRRPSEDSLWTVWGDRDSGSLGGPPGIDITVRSLVGRIWRSEGLVASADGFYAVGLGVGEKGQELYGVRIDPASGEGEFRTHSVEEGGSQDVTTRVKMIFGGSQSFDPTTGILGVDLRILNSGDTPLWVPIRVVAQQVDASPCKVTVLNSDNAVTGSGAAWDVSGSVTGDRIPGQTAMFNAVRLQFRVDVSNCSSPPSRLLNLRIRVFARTSPSNTNAALDDRATTKETAVN
jgi:hypothetical protein